jgi:hypothetical protein
MGLTKMVMHASANLTHSSLKGDVLCIFNDKVAKQEKETKDSHIKCLHIIMEQVFPKDNQLQKQKMHMCKQPHVSALK